MVPANRDPMRPAPAPLRKPASVHVVEHELAEDADAHVEGHREGDVVQHAQARGEVGDLALVEREGACAGQAEGFGLGELSLFEAGRR